MCETSGCTDPTDLASFGEEEDDESVKLKRCFSWWEPGHDENEFGDFPTDPLADRCAGVKEDHVASQQNVLEEEGQAC